MSEASFEAPGAEPELAVPDLPARATSVLLVEDSAEDAALIASQLRAVWSDLFDVGRVATLREALRLFGVGRADCVLLDLTLPDARELEALQRLVGEAPDVPIVILTGVDDGPLALRAVREGAQDYLIKGRADGEAIGRAIQYAIQRKRAEVAERTAADLFRVALQGTGMVVCHQDRDLRYTWVHTTPGSAFPVATLGKTDADLLSPEEGAEIEAIKRRVLATGVGSIQEVTVTVAGEPRVFRLVVEPMRNPAATIVGVTSATYDITDRVRAEEALRRTHGELAHFAAAVADELRAGTDRGEIADALLAWAEAAQVAIASDPVDLGAAFERARQGLHGEISADELPIVRGDAAQLERVLRNLMDNGLKFNGSSRPRVHVSARREPRGWQVSVADNGIGVPPEARERILRPLTRLHPRGAYPGMGMGLAIASKIVSRHGGRLWMASAPEGGTVVGFVLPDGPFGPPA